jgi:hypothetical protein
MFQRKSSQQGTEMVLMSDDVGVSLGSDSPDDSAMETSLFSTSGRGLIVDQLVQAGTFVLDKRAQGVEDHKADVDIESGIKTKEIKETAKLGTMFGVVSDEEVWELEGVKDKGGVWRQGRGCERDKGAGRISLASPLLIVLHLLPRLLPLSSTYPPSPSLPRSTSPACRTSSE